MKPKFEVNDLTLIFPAGCGGNFLISLCYPSNYSTFSQPFNEYKMNYESILADDESNKLGWFFADNVFAETGIEYLDHDKFSRPTKDLKYRLAFGHHLPTNTDFNYVFSTKHMLELVANDTDSRNIVRMLAKVKNDVFTDFARKPYQIDHILTTMLEIQLQSGYTTPDVLVKLAGDKLHARVLHLADLVSRAGKNDNVLYSSGSIIMWKYALTCAIYDLECTLESFNEFLRNQFKVMADNIEHDLELRFNKQTQLRRYFTETQRMITVNYSAMFFDLMVPKHLIESVHPEYKGKAFHLIAAYSKRNLLICSQANDILGNNEYNTTIQNCLDRLKNACGRLEINYEELK